ncbi:eukaryotic rRNA processing protein EBP2-domain-containing protein [Cytidiella melzeri]|nr:eukaryotic rRNA processing protein EBP2-domain-containing protein [Cytidiella melzeri]
MSSRDKSSKPKKTGSRLTEPSSSNIAPPSTVSKPPKKQVLKDKVAPTQHEEAHSLLRDDDDSEGSDSEEEDVDEEGMSRLMKALGDDGLDELAEAELRALKGEGGEEEGSGEEEESDEEVREQEVEEVSSEEEEEEEENEQDGAIEEEEEASADEEDAGDVPLDEIESVDEDAVPQQKVEIDNKIVLARIRETIKLDPSIPWTDTLVVSYPDTIDVDVDDDLNRELAIYKQALHGAQHAKKLAAKHNLPFTRPADYFAEMVKSDAHMERIRQRLLDEGATIKRSEEKRKEREGKKFGKQVQMEKLKERERSKKDMEERLKGLKRSKSFLPERKGALDNAQEDDDGFDVAVEDAISDRPNKRSRGGADGGKRTMNRQARDRKFGVGGPGRRGKQNTKDSTDNFESRGGGRPTRGGRGGQSSRGGRGGRGGARGGGGSKRLGKSRRMDARSRS